MSRPPEGYCGTCRYMIELTEEGRLRNHGRRTIYSSGSVAGHTDACEGTGALPVPVPGAEDPDVAFTSEERVARCPVCKAEDAVDRETNGRTYMVWHRAPVISQDLPGNACPGTWEPIEYV